MRCVLPQDKEKINQVAHELKEMYGYGFSFSQVARKTGWSETTVRKYFDKDWYPGKYFQMPIKTEKIPKTLEHPGLYMLSQQIVEDGHIINLIKVGQSTNLKKRLHSYQGMNPFAKCVDTMELLAEDLDEYEKAYHTMLGTKNKRYGQTEWFVCDDEQYNYWINKKFSLK